MHAILLGPPGAGKGTQAERICREHDLLHVSTGDLLRDAVAAGTELGVEARGYMDRGELVPDALVLALLLERLGSDPRAGFLLDGFPRNVSQAEALETELGREAIEHVLYLQLGDEEILARLLGRGRPDDTEAVIRMRLAVYRSATEPLVAWYEERGLLRRVDGAGTIEEVGERIREALADAGAARASGS